MDYLDARRVDYARGAITVHLNDQIVRLERELAHVRSVAINLDDQVGRLDDELGHARRKANKFRARLRNAERTVRELRGELELQRTTAAAVRREQEFEMLAAAAQLASMNEGGLGGTASEHLDREVGGSGTGLDAGSSLPISTPVPERGVEGEEDEYAGGQDSNGDRSPATLSAPPHASIESPSPRLPGPSRFRAPHGKRKRKADAAEVNSRSPSPAPTRQRQLWSQNEQRFTSYESARGEADDAYAADPTSPVRLDCDTPTTKSDDQTYNPSDHSVFEWDSDPASRGDGDASVSEFNDKSQPARASPSTRSSAPSPVPPSPKPASATPLSSILPSPRPTSTTPLSSNAPSPNPSSPTPPSPTPPAPALANPPSLPPKTRRYARSRQTVRRFAVGTVPGIHFEFTRKARTVAEIYREWYVGTPSTTRGGVPNPPIATLEREHGTAWRSDPDEKENMKYASNYVSVRRLIVEFVDREVERRRADWAADGIGEGEGEEEFEAEDVCRELDDVVRGKIQKLTECLRARRDPFEEFGS